MSVEEVTAGLHEGQNAVKEFAVPQIEIEIAAGEIAAQAAVAKEAVDKICDLMAGMKEKIGPNVDMQQGALERLGEGINKVTAAADGSDKLQDSTAIMAGVQARGEETILQLEALGDKFETAGGELAMMSELLGVIGVEAQVVNAAAHENAEHAIQAHNALLTYREQLAGA